MMNRNLINVCLILLLVSSNVLSQNTEKLLSTFSYDRASTVLEKKLKKNPQDVETRLELARVYAKVGDTQSSLFQYNQVVHSESIELLTDFDWNNVAHYNFAFGNLSEANFAFKKVSNNDDFLMFNFQQKSSFYTIEKLDLNTEYSEFSPFLDDSSLIFSSDRPASVYDVNKSKWSGNPFLSQFKIKDGKVTLYDSKLSDPYHVGPASLTKSLDRLFITKTTKIKGSEVAHAKIYYSDLSKGEWSSLQSIPEINCDDCSNAHPVYLEKYNMLVFASNRPGGYGGMDLYYSTNENGIWTKPINCGDSINTRFNDVFPCYSTETPDVLYFSSNGYLGYGGLDVYAVNLLDAEWARPILLAKSINSEYDDFGIYFESKTEGYISSNRKGGLGLDDIYRFKLSETVVISGFLVDRFDIPVENKKIYLSKENHFTFDSIYSDENGFFQYNKLPYETVNISPEDENGVEMIIRPFDEKIGKDMNTNAVFSSSLAQRIDSVSLSSFVNLKLVLESFDEVEKRCVEYQNGEKAVRVTFVVRDANGNFLEKARTNDQGCLILKKLYGDNVFLELDTEEDLQLGIRFAKNTDNQFSLKSNEGLIVLTRTKKCVEFENGDAVSNFYFVVKNDMGVVIDSLKTDSLGCFNLHKLYDKSSYLEIADEEMYNLGIRIKDQGDNENWTDLDHKVILIAPSKCVVYLDGTVGANENLVIKNREGEFVGNVLTDNNGCFYLKKLYHESDFLELEDENGVTLQARMGKENVVLLQNSLQAGEISLNGKIFNYPKANSGKEVEVLLLSNNGVVQKRTIVNSIGEFEFQKLADDSKLFIQILDDAKLLSKNKKIQVQGKVSNPNKADKVVYLLNSNGEKFTSAEIDETNSFNLVYSLEEYLDKDSTQKETYFDGIATNKKDQTVIQNIYFENGKWNVDLAAEKVLDELIQILKTNIDLKIVINAHTDSRGTSHDNLLLSNKRAQSVTTYVKNSGVDESRLKSFGHGEAKLINHCNDNSSCTDKQHSQNRRIEFEFVWN